jgi:hypothetical protein
MSGLVIKEDGKKHHIPRRYIPNNLTKKDKTREMNYIKKSRSSYKKGLYYRRPNVKSFSVKQSYHIENAKKLYGIENMAINSELSKKTGCSISSMEKIVEKGKGAYYSSGSRPNQTPESWGYARLASALTGGNSSIVDYSILVDGCKKNSIALKLARKTKKNKEKL